MTGNDLGYQCPFGFPGSRSRTACRPCTAAGSPSYGHCAGEYRFGILGSSIRRQAEAGLEELEKVCRVLAIDATTSRVYAEIRHELKREGQPIPENDIWIAALARQHHLPIVSRDQHFDAIRGLRRISW